MLIRELLFRRAITTDPKNIELGNLPAYRQGNRILPMVLHPYIYETAACA